MFTQKELDILKEIVEEWVSEDFTYNYTKEHIAIFEKLDMNFIIKS